MTELRTCGYCDAVIEYLRSTARYCGPSCRARAAKARKRAEGLDPYEPWPTSSETKTTSDPARNVPIGASEGDRPKRRGRRDTGDTRWRVSLRPEQARQILAAVDDPELQRRLMDASPEAVRRRRAEREAR